MVARPPAADFFVPDWDTTSITMAARIANQIRRILGWKLRVGSSGGVGGLFSTIYNNVAESP